MQIHHKDVLAPSAAARAYCHYFIAACNIIHAGFFLPKICSFDNSHRSCAALALHRTLEVAGFISIAARISRIRLHSHLSNGEVTSRVPLPPSLTFHLLYQNDTSSLIIFHLSLNNKFLSHNIPYTSPVTDTSTNSNSTIHFILKRLLSIETAIATSLLSIAVLLLNFPIAAVTVTRYSDAGSITHLSSSGAGP